jgi:hypothetical protein
MWAVPTRQSATAYRPDRWGGDHGALQKANSCAAVYNYDIDIKNNILSYFIHVLPNIFTLMIFSRALTKCVVFGPSPI